MPRAPRIRPTIEGWLKELTGGGLEIYLRVANYQGQPGRKIRASGSKAEMLELVEWFESKTGLSVNHPILPRVAQPIPGQTQLDLGTVPKGTAAPPELSSDATLAS